MSADEDQLMRQVDDWRYQFLRDHRFTPNTREDMVDRWGEDVTSAWQAYDDAREQRRAAEQVEEQRREKLRSQAQAARERKELLTASQIPARYHGSTFDAIDRNRQPEAYDACKAYLAKGESPEGHPCLLLSGPPGTGKTTLACACLLAGIAHQRPVRFANLSRYLQRLRESMNTKGNDGSILDLASGYKLLVIDDLGRQRLTEWGAEQLYTLLDTLYSESKRVIFTSNVSGQQLREFLDEALSSRLDQMCHRLVLAGDDLRKAVSPATSQGSLELPDATERDEDPRAAALDDMMRS